MDVRRRALLLSGLGAAVSGLSGCGTSGREEGTDTPTFELPTDGDSWPTIAADAANTGTNPSASGPKDEPRIERTFSADVGNFNPPAVADDLIFLPKSTGYATNFVVDSVENGDRQWSLENVDGGVIGSPTVAGNSVFFGSAGGTVHSYTIAEGERRWKHGVQGGISGGITLVDGVLYVATERGNAYAIEASTGKRLWRWIAPALHMWWTPPAVTEQVVVFGVEESVVALEAGDGTQRWRLDLDTEANTPPTISDGTAYLADVSGTLRAVSVADGSVLWTVETDGSKPASATVVDDTIFYATDRLYAIHTDTGEVSWSVDISPNPNSLPATDGERLYVCSNAELVALDPDDGTKLWSFRTDLPTAYTPVVAGGSVYLPAGNAAPGDDQKPVVYKLSD